MNRRREFAGNVTADSTQTAITSFACSPDEQTPLPWSNVIANPRFGFLVTESGGGYTWAGNSRENKLTSWSNDPVTDPPSEIIYLRDEETRRRSGRHAAARRVTRRSIASNTVAVTRVSLTPHDGITQRAAALDRSQYVRQVRLPQAQELQPIGRARCRRRTTPNGCWA